MEDKLNNLKAHVEVVTLTAAEKSAGREVLRSYMALTPNRAAQVRSPKASLFGSLRLSYVGRAAGVFAASFALLLSAAGISYAAESALPGEALYAVKVSFNEPVRSVLAVSEKDRAEWSAERASRRLAEAEVLASRGNLKAATRVALDADFHRFSEKAELHLAKVKEEDGNGVAADVSAHIEGTLRAHSQIMAAIGEERRQKHKGDDSKDDSADASDDEDGRQVAALAASVDQQVTATVKESDAAEEHASSEDTDKSAGFARGRHDVAVKKIAEVRSWLTSKAGSFTAESQTEANTRLAAADAAVAAGDAALTAGKNRDAFASYARAQRLAQEAKLIVRASNALGVRVRFKNEVADDGSDSDKKGKDKSEDDGLKVNIDTGVHLDGLFGGKDRGRDERDGRDN